MTPRCQVKQLHLAQSRNFHAVFTLPRMMEIRTYLPHTERTGTTLETRDNSGGSGPSSRRRWLAPAAGLAVTAVVALIDAALGADVILTTALILGPFVTALLGSPRQTMMVVVVAVLLAAVSGTWNENAWEVDYFLRWAIVIAGGAVAVVGARARSRADRAGGRFRVLMDAARVVDDTLTLQQTVERLSNLIVPGAADLCIFDVNRGGGLERLKVRASGPEAEKIEAFLFEHGPVRTQGGTELMELVASGRAQLVENVSEEHLWLLARDDADLERFRELSIYSGIAAPLRARGRTLGTLILAVTKESGRAYGPDDLELAELLAGRSGLALDNAGLFTELTAAEAQLSAVVGSLAEAVTVQSVEGSLVYANQAAADALGFESVEQLLATPMEQIVDRFESYHEDGSPLRMEDLPGRRVLLGEEAPPVVVRAIDKTTGEERWRVTKATAVRNREGQVQLAVNIIEDITEVKKAELSQALLAEVGEVLASSLDYQRTLQRVAELAVPKLADWCGVSMPDPDGCIRQVAVAHVDPEKVAFARRLSERYPVRADEPTGTAAVIRDGQTQLINNISDELIEQAAKDPEHLALIRELGMHSAMVVPMATPAGVIGALTLVTAESARTFSSADVDLAEEMGRRAGAAVENARLYTERSHIARTLQRGLLPPQLPDMPGWASATLYRPAGDENWVGGDFYDAFPIEGGWMLVVGDVVGHGPEAAALTAEARYTLRTAAMLSGSALVALDQLNRGLFARDPGMALCTAACVTLTEVGGKGVAEVVCAGHPPPLRVRDGQVEAVGRAGPMLGAWEEKAWAPVAVALDPGDVLVLYTDGVVDTQGESERFGEERLRTAIADVGDAVDAVARIGAELTRFEVGEQSDDTAVLAVSRVPVTEQVAGAADSETGSF